MGQVSLLGSGKIKFKLNGKIKTKKYIIYICFWQHVCMSITYGQAKEANTCIVICDFGSNSIEHDVQPSKRGK
jgi:hypothetical protein